jgi:hypothetical protein
MAMTIGIPLLVLAGILAFWIVSKRIARFKGPGLTDTAPTFSGPALAGTARVVSLEGTSMTTGASHVCDIGLSVEIPGHAPYNVALRWPVHPVEIPRVQPGATVAVQVDSSDLQKVVIEL